MGNFSLTPLGPGRARWRAFTLLEVLVAVAVLGILLVLLVQIADNAVHAVHTSRQQISATQQARAVLDALESDFGGLVVENGLPVFAKPSLPQGNSELVFFTRGRGPSGTPDFRFTAVAYRLENTELIRSWSSVAWSDSDLVQRLASAPASSSRSVLARGILRFEAVAVRKNGESVPLAQAGRATLLGMAIPGGLLALDRTTPPAPSASEQIVSVTIAVAAIDEQNLQLPGVLEMAEKLGDPAAGEAPLEAWKQRLNSGALDDIPAPARHALRLSQQTFSVE